MLGLIAIALTVGLADSLNPSTVGPALYLALGRDPVRRVAAFALGVFAVSFAGGTILTLGPGRALIALVPRPGPHATHLIELAVGIALAVLAAGLWIGRERMAAHLAREPARSGRSSLVVGATIMAVELPTAFPYFAVILAILGSRTAVPGQVVVLLVFNVAFVAPLLLIAAARGLAGDGGAKVMERVRAAIDRRAAVLLSALVFAVAVVVASVGTVGLVR